jgi:hypothetical protein
MIQITHGSHSEIKCVWLNNLHVSLAVSVERGLRALHFSFDGKENIFVELGEMAIGPENNLYELIGGHRLWHSPEWAPRTYLPEPTPFEIVVSDKGVSVCAPADETGISKTMVFEIVQEKPQVIVNHILRNESLWRIELSPWAITQCKPGGIVLCPECTDVLNQNIATPNRSWVFWPFTDIQDRRFQFCNRMSTVKAIPGPPTKIGYRNFQGWIGYWLGDVIFTKHFNPSIDRNHPDMGCNSEIYVCDEFVEIETLAPLSHLEPGESVCHTEIWTLWEASAYTEDKILLAENTSSIPDYSGLSN